MKKNLLITFIVFSTLLHILLILIPINYTDSIKFEKKIEPIVISMRLLPPLHLWMGSDGFARNDDAARIEADKKETLTNYKLILESRIYKNLYIPSALKKKHLDLSSLVELDIRRDGSLMSINLIKQSGNELIDNLVLTAIKDASPFPPLPTNYKNNNLKVALPLRFRVL